MSCFSLSFSAWIAKAAASKGWPLLPKRAVWSLGLVAEVGPTMSSSSAASTPSCFSCLIPAILVLGLLQVGQEDVLLQVGALGLLQVGEEVGEECAANG